jgi:hypothetical protein
MNLLLLLIIAITATAPATNPTTPPATTIASAPPDPLLTLRAFESAMNAGDSIALRDTCAGTPEQLAAAVAICDESLAQHQLYSAARAKFADADAARITPPNYVPIHFSLDDPALTVTIDGQSARVTLPSRPHPIVALARDNNGWKVDLSSIAFISRSPAALAQQEKTLATVERSLAHEIQSGKYADPDAAIAAKNQELSRSIQSR